MTTDVQSRRTEDKFMGRSFDRALNVIQIVAIVGGGFYALGQMRSSIDNVNTNLAAFETRIDNTVTGLSSRIDSVVDKSKD